MHLPQATQISLENSMHRSIEPQCSVMHGPHGIIVASPKCHCLPIRHCRFFACASNLLRRGARLAARGASGPTFGPTADTRTWAVAPLRRSQRAQIAAAVDQHVLAGDVAGVRGAEERDDGAEFLG